MGSRSPINPLPIEVLFLKAEKRREGVEISWRPVNDAAIDLYEVEKTRDLENYVKIAEVSNSALESKDIYKALDNFPTFGRSFYRLKQVKRNGEPSYSNLVEVNYTPDYSHTHLYPNPFKNSFVVQIGDLRSEKVTIEITKVDGKMVFFKEFYSNEDFDTININMEGEKAGVYVLAIKTRSRSFRKIIIKE